MTTQTIGIIGAGTMGHGIAHVCALFGFNVTLGDVSQPSVDRGLATIERNLAREVSKAKLTQDDATAALARIAPTTTLEAFTPCTLVIEAATEKVEVKTEIFCSLDRTLASEAI